MRNLKCSLFYAPPTEFLAQIHCSFLFGVNPDQTFVNLILSASDSPWHVFWCEANTLTASPSSTQAGHCVRAKMRFACMLNWITHAGSGNLDPCGLPSVFGPKTRDFCFFFFFFQAPTSNTYHSLIGSESPLLPKKENPKVKVIDMGNRKFLLSLQLSAGAPHPSTVPFLTLGEMCVWKG